jgi:hypothetical protein
MRRNLSLGILVAVMVYVTVTAISFLSEKEQIRETIEPIPKILVIPPPEIEPLEFHPLHDNIAQPKFEIKIQNESEDEVLEMVATLSDAKEYIAEYGQYHEDLFVYNIETKKLVLSSNKNH